MLNNQEEKPEINDLSRVLQVTFLKGDLQYLPFHGHRIR